MLGDIDLNDRHQIEQLRRSVAMLQQGAAVFGREDSLRLLAELERRVATAG